MCHYHTVGLATAFYMISIDATCPNHQFACVMIALPYPLSCIPRLAHAVSDRYRKPARGLIAIIAPPPQYQEDDQGDKGTETDADERELYRRQVLRSAHRRAGTTVSLHIQPLLRHVAALGMHEQPLGVDAIGRTGDQGDEILAVLDGQIVRLVWEDHLGRRDPIGVILSEDADDEPVPDLELGQAVEDASGRKPRVTGEDAVGGIPTDGKGGARHVPDAMVHAVSINPVVDGKVDTDAGYDELAHDPVPNQVEHALVLLVAGRSRVWVKWVGHVDAARADALVEVLRLLPFRREVLGRGAGHGRRWSTGIPAALSGGPCSARTTLRVVRFHVGVRG